MGLFNAAVNSNGFMRQNKGQCSGSWAEENAALYMSAGQLCPALAEDMAALPHHLLGWDVTPDRKGVSSWLLLPLCSPCPKAVVGLLCPRSWAGATQPIGQTLVLNVFLVPAACQRQHSPVDTLWMGKAGFCVWPLCLSGFIPSPFSTNE